MNPSQFTLPERIVVELQPGADIRLATGMAARLARIFGCKIKGVFIEDVRLQELAELAIAMEISIIDRQLRTLHAAALPTELRRSQEAARRDFEALAMELEVEVELEVARGSPRASSEMQPDDILLAGAALDRAFHESLLEQISAAKVLGVAFPAARRPQWQGEVMAVLGSEPTRLRFDPLLRRITDAEQAELEIDVAEDPLAALLQVVEQAERSVARVRLPRMIVAETGLLDSPDARLLRSVIRRMGCPVLLINTDPSDTGKSRPAD